MKTIYRLAQFNRLLNGHRTKFAAAFLAHNPGMRHLAIRLDPIMACNLRCQMCFFSNEEYVRKSKGVFTEGDIARLAEMLFPHIEKFITYGLDELTISVHGVTKETYDWRHETYDEFCKRIGWSKYLIKAAMSSPREVAKSSGGAWSRHSAKYEVI